MLRGMAMKNKKIKIKAVKRRMICFAVFIYFPKNTIKVFNTKYWKNY